jgi:predicted  nucleic acid-binding Zn-ribbon protein
LNGRTTVPTGAWKKELADLTAERQQLNSEYVALKDEVQKIEKISRNVQDILHQEQQMEQPSHKRSQGMDI